MVTETQEVKHYQVEQRYRIKIERAASTKGTLGYTVEANGDDIAQVEMDAKYLKQQAEQIAGAPVAEAKKE